MHSLWTRGGVAAGGLDTCPHHQHNHTHTHTQGQIHLTVLCVLLNACCHGKEWPKQKAQAKSRAKQRQPTKMRKKVKGKEHRYTDIKGWVASGGWAFGPFPIAHLYAPSSRCLSFLVGRTRTQKAPQQSEILVFSPSLNSLFVFFSWN